MSAGADRKRRAPERISFSEALRAYRKSLGLTQAQLAARWGMAPNNTLARWEQGERTPALEGPIRRLMLLDRE